MSAKPLDCHQTPLEVSERPPQIHQNTTIITTIAALEAALKSDDEESLQLLYIDTEILSKFFLAGNSKKHAIAELEEMVARHGFRIPMVFDTNLNEGRGGIVAGNGRLEMLRDLQSGGFPAPRGVLAQDGKWFAPLLVGLNAENEVEAIAFSIDDNLAAVGGAELKVLTKALMFDSEALMAQLAALGEAEALPVGLGEEDLARLEAALNGVGSWDGAEEVEEIGQGGDRAPVVEEDEGALDAIVEEIEEGAIVSRVKLGDIWACGRHRVCCGDSTIEENLEKALEGRVPGFVFCDPPYGISIVATNGYVGGGEVNNIPFGGVKNETPEEKKKRMGYVGGGNCRPTTITECAAKRLGSIGGSKPFGSADVRGSDGASNVVAVNKYMPIIGDASTDTAIASFNAAIALAPKAAHIWWGGNYFSSALPDSSCWVVWDKQNTGNFADAELAWTNQKTAVRIFQHMWNGMVKASEHGQRRVHPTQKPIALAVWCFESYGKPDDLILDQFLGSGISIIAAQQMEGNRTVVGFELSQDYCEIVLRRYEALTGEVAKLIDHLP
jgi:hypothetical protein